MRKLPLLFLLILLSSLTTYGQTSPKPITIPCHFSCKESLAEFATGVAMDMASQSRVESRGGIESGLFATKDHKLNKPLYLGISAAIGLGLYELRIHSHSTTNARIYEWMARGLGYVHIGVAIHNYHLASTLKK